MSEALLLNTLDLAIEERLKSDPEFRREWFRAELEQGVPEQIRAMREVRGMSQTDLAVAAQMHQPAIARLERSGKANWNVETLIRVAEAMGACLVIRFVPHEDAIEGIDVK